MANRTDPGYVYGKYKIYFGGGKEFDICYDDFIAETNNYWQATNPAVKSLPIFMMQLGVLILVSRVLALILKPLRQPYFLPELLTGVLLGPTVVGLEPSLSNALTPYEGALFLHTISELGVTFYMFLVGLEMDFTPIRKVGRTALSVAIVGLILPMCAGGALHYLIHRNQAEPKSPWEGFWSWAIAIGVTSFPDLARILADLKLLYTDLGKTALSASVISDLISWLLIMVTMSVVNGQNALYVAIPVMVCMTAFWFMIRPSISWLLNKSAERIDQSFLTKGQYSDKHVYFILIAVILCGYFTELCGAHAMFGAFMFGLIIPSGEFGTFVMEKIEEFVVGIMLPPVFLITGTRTHLALIFYSISPSLVALVVLLACSAKIVSTLLVCLLLNAPMRDSLALGFLMNTKGILVLIILNQARANKVMDQPVFSCMILIILVMTTLITPVVNYTHKYVRHMRQSFPRNLEKSKPDLPLRVLACIHSTKNLSTLINLLRISNATRKSPLTVFSVHLVELVGRTTALLIFHDKKGDNLNNKNATRERAEAEQIASAFESLEQESQAISVHQLTAVSPYDTMHEDVGNFALNKLTSIILISFHKQPDSHGGWREENLQHKQVNENLLATAPCPVGILVDRGLTLLFSQENSRSIRHVFRLAMLFVEGPDDREALAYAWRMAGTPCLTLTVFRFTPGQDASELTPSEDVDDDALAAMFERDNERQRDDDYINEFRFKTMNDQSITYIEKQVNSGEEIMSTISSSYNHFDLYVVGRGHGTKSPLLSALSWCDYPELGPLGETLTSIESESPASVLVVQQYAPMQSGSKKTKSSSRTDHVFVNHRKWDDD